MPYVIALLTALGTVYCLVPGARWAALQYGFVDRPGHRKIHREPIPLLGGTAMFIGCMGALGLFVGVTPFTIAAMIGGILLLGIGLLDDFHKTRGREFSVWPRVLVYAAVSAVPLAFGIRIEGLRLLGETVWIFTEPLAALVTMLWMFALINMMNFIDGVDGLAAGIGVISAVTLWTVALLKGQPESALAAAIVTGTALGFLAYNFYPAKIFMGDAGATFLGYMLALIAVDGTLKSATALSIFVPVLALGVPILDTAIVFARRILSGKGLHRADKLHTHHTLMHWGLSQPQTVSFLYLVGTVFSLISILLLLILR